MGSLFWRDSVFICLLFPENMIICDKCPSKYGKQAKLNDFASLLQFAFLSHFVLYRVNAKCNIFITFCIIITFCVVTTLCASVWKEI